jgi:hypothetical protein
MQHFAKETIVRLAEARVEFIVVGGLSAVLQGVPLLVAPSPHFPPATTSLA